jgi:SAM-dependent methyltransferase
MKRAPLSMYKTLCTEFYDLVPHSDGAAALSFYLDYAFAAQGPILEPMCGTGRFLIPMLQHGLDIEGFDASSSMLSALKQKYALVSSKPAPVWHQFIEDFKRDKQYNLIFVPYGSWGHILDPKDSLAALRNMYEHLTPKSKLILALDTVASTPQTRDAWEHTVRSRTDGSWIALNTYVTYDHARQLYHAQCHYQALAEGNIITETEDFTMYLYRFNQMDELLKKAGFTTVQKYQDYQKTPATNQEAPLLIYEATK